MLNSVKQACVIAGFLLFTFLLTACQSSPQADKLKQEGMASLPPSYVIDDVPFYPQEQFYCGPTTLSEVFGFYGVDIPPKDIAPKIFIPDKNGSLQLEMVSAARSYGFLPYSSRGTLTSIIELINDDIPVIVFQNLSIQLLPQWHYAVVFGHNNEKGTVTLHTGVTMQHEMSLALFEKTWARGNYWFLAPVPPDVASSAMEPFTYISAAYDMLKIGKDDVALPLLKTATKQWPSEWLSFFLIANHYAQQDSLTALNWFSDGYPIAKTQQPFVHNYIIELLKHGKRDKAKEIADSAENTFPNDDAIATIIADHNL